MAKGDTAVIGHRRYEWYASYATRREAQAKANWAHGFGLARVTREGNRYIVWVAPNRR